MLSTGVVVEGTKCEQLEKVVIKEDEDKFFQVGAWLPPREMQQLMDFLRKNIDVFTWSAYDAPGIDSDFICHHLNVNSFAIPKKQSHWHSSREHSDAVKGEVLKLNRARAIKELFFLEWLANIVVVKKKTEKWWVCVDFADLNKGCSKDLFPRIDQLVDATVGHYWMSFLDAF